jgi:hypothetical protein
MSFAPAGRPAVIRAERNQPDIMLRVRSEYLVSEDQFPQSRYRAVFVSYNYQILDLSGREILGFHWHPTGVSSVTYPHLHLTSRIRPIETGDPSNPQRKPSQIPLAEMHIPTGPVLFENVVRLLIEEFGVIPLRPDWDEILLRNEALLRATD